MPLLLVGCAAAGGQAIPTAALRAQTPAARATPTLAASAQPTSTLAPFAGARSIADPFAPELGNGGYFVQHYHLRLALDPDERFLRGVATLDLISAQDGLQQLALDFVGFSVTAAAVDGTGVTTGREGQKLVVTLPQTLPAGMPFTLSIGYEGNPITEPSPFIDFFDHLGLIYPGDGTVYAFNQPDGARYWFPANDHPRDKATFRFEVTVPQGLTGLANGTLIDRFGQPLPDGSAGETFVWDHPYPLATNLAMVAAGPFRRIEGRSPAGIPLRHYVLPELEEAFLEIEPQVGPALDWLAERLGPYPYDTFGFVTVNGTRLSLETQGLVLLSSRTINENIMAHEIAHMWLGNWVSIDSWGDLWRNEGVATYLAALWETRDSPAALDDFVVRTADHVAETTAGYPLNAQPQDQIFSSDTYFNSALLFHRLRSEMGDPAFFNGLRLFLTRYGGSSADQAAFQQAMEEAAGFSLAGTFDLWLAP
jgi:aminopeptidase N